MRLTTGHWNAARLVAFANLRPTEADWQSFFDDGLRLEMDGTGRLTRRPAGALWLAFIAELRRCAWREVPPPGEAIGRARASRDRQLPETATEVWSANLTDYPDQEPLCWDDFHAHHNLTRHRLLSICTNNDLDSLVHDLLAHPIGGGVLVAQGRNVTSRSRFTLLEGGGGSLPWTLDEMFSRSALGGFWGKFFTCADCGRFGIARVTRRARAFCTDECRDKYNRPVKLGRRQERRVALRRRLERQLETLEKGGVPRAETWMRACEQMGLTQRQAEALWAVEPAEPAMSEVRRRLVSAWQCATEEQRVAFAEWIRTQRD